MSTNGLPGHEAGYPTYILMLSMVSGCIQARDSIKRCHCGICIVIYRLLENWDHQFESH
jgi:hypothetical protein